MKKHSIKKWILATVIALNMVALVLFVRFVTRSTPLNVRKSLDEEIYGEIYKVHDEYAVSDPSQKGKAFGVSNISQDRNAHALMYTARMRMWDTNKREFHLEVTLVKTVFGWQHSWKYTQ